MLQSRPSCPSSLFPQHTAAVPASAQLCVAPAEIESAFWSGLPSRESTSIGGVVASIGSMFDVLGTLVGTTGFNPLSCFGQYLRRLLPLSLVLQLLNLGKIHTVETDLCRMQTA